MKHLITFLALLPLLSSAEKPNILFIMADDLGYQDVGFMGSSYFETPNLDALAEESLVIENAFMYPTCSPSRSALLTGRHSFRTQSYCVPVLEQGKPNDGIFSKWTITEEHPVYSQPLREAGYQLMHLGKWHIVGPDPKGEAEPLAAGKKIGQPKNGDLSWLEEHNTPEIQQYYPLGRGFHENVGGTWWGDPSRGYDKGYNAPGGGYIAPFKNPFMEESEDGAWLTDRLTDDAIDFMEQNQEAPFFINLHYYAPHRPSIARSEELVAHFKQKPGDPQTGQGMGKKKEIAEYATMVKSLDDNIGRLLTALDERGLRGNTIIIFTSDNGHNGLQSTTKNLRGAKGNIYDGGLRVPCLIHCPEKVSAGKSSTPVYAVDYFPTFLDLAGITDYAETLDGTSITPLMTGDALSPRPLYWHLPTRYKDAPCSIIREGEWKLIQFLLSEKVELYNTAQDLAEKKDLSASHKEKTAELLEKLTDWRKENQVPLPKNSPLSY